MAKITEKQLNEQCRSLNTSLLQETPFGIKVVRGSSGYSVITVTRSTGGAAAIGDTDMTASEAAALIAGYTKGVEVGAMAKHVYCPFCNAKATLVQEDEWTKEHIFCQNCGKRSRRGEKG